jgi:hypothetical protein
LVLFDNGTIGAGHNQSENGDTTGYCGIEKDVRVEKFKWEEKLKIDTSIKSDNVENTGNIQVKIQLADLFK